MNNSQGAIPSPRVSRLAGLIAVLLGCAPFVGQADDYFDPELLGIGNAQQGNIDLTVFEKGSSQAPGTYRVDIYLNNVLKETRDVEFMLVKGTDGKNSLQPCLSIAQLKDMGVKTDLFPGVGDGSAQCATLSAIAQANADFQFAKQRLLLSMPQAALVQQAFDYIPENQWDKGIPALLLNYNLSGATTFSRQGGRDSSSQFANLRPGINIGSWRLRNYTSWDRDNSGQSQWSTIYTYAQRDLVGLKSQLILGDSSSPGEVFDSVPFRGVQLASNDSMLPDSLRGYAPVVRGIARSNAEVIIRQNNQMIYQRFVPPGAFEINDLFPTSGSGDLVVTIKESDGSEQHLVVPVASLAILQREGQLKYSMTSGQYRSYDSSVDKTVFGQGTAIYGLPLAITAYGGGQFANNYQSLAVGVGKNLGGFGALSFDLTQAWSAIEDQVRERGQSWRIRYSKSIANTNLAIAGYRYSTEGYYSLQEVMDSNRDGSNNQRMWERRRNRSELTLSQNLWEGAGSVSLNWVREDYWNSDRTIRSMGASYNNNWNSISYGLNYSYNENSVAAGGQGRVYDRDQVFSLNVSLPLNRWLSNTYASYNLSTSRKKGSSNTVRMSGTALEDNNLSWGIQQGYGPRGTGNSGNLNTDYRGTYGGVTAGYAYDQNSQRLNYGLQGGIVAHEEGVTFGQSLGDTVVLVKAPGAKGIKVNNHRGVKTDWRGYAIVPYSNPYRKNTIQLNAEMLPDNVELALTSQNVVPTGGAVAKASFETSVGQRVLMTLLREGGQPVSFGAIVSDPSKKSAQGFIVGDSGQVYLTGLAESGILNVSWGDDTGQQCQVKYSLEKQTAENAGIQSVQATCL